MWVWKRHRLYYVQQSLQHQYESHQTLSWDEDQDTELFWQGYWGWETGQLRPLCLWSFFSLSGGKKNEVHYQWEVAGQISLYYLWDCPLETITQDNKAYQPHKNVSVVLHVFSCLKNDNRAKQYFTVFNKYNVTYTVNVIKVKTQSR